MRKEMGSGEGSLVVGAEISTEETCIQPDPANNPHDELKEPESLLE